MLGKFFSHVHLFDNNTGVNCANGRGLGIAKALNCGGIAKALNCGGDEGDRVGYCKQGWQETCGM